MGVFKEYWIGWLLLSGFLGCFIAAALYFELSDHKFIIASFLQGAAVALALALAYFFFERRSHQRQKRIEDVMTESVKGLRERAASAVITASGVTQHQPPGHDSFGPNTEAKVYKQARQLVLDRSRQLFDYPNNLHHRGTLYWVVRRFEDLAFECSQMIRSLSPAIIEYGVLRRAILDFEGLVNTEAKVWDELYRRPPDQTDKSLPAEAEYNLMVLAEVIVRLVDVFDSENYVGDPEHEEVKKYAPPTFHRSSNWGLWR